MKNIRIWRSPATHFGMFGKGLDDLDNETMSANNVYTDEELIKIASSGFNAIWVHGLLRNVVKSDVFPEFGEHAELHLENMCALIKRADKHGIKVFIYMQPPRAIDVENPFWEKHSDAGGGSISRKDDYGNDITAKCLCTSSEKVKKYLEDSSARLIEELPGLGGIILITASEYPSHCWGRASYVVNDEDKAEPKNISCPICIKRNPVDVVSEIIQLIRNGVRSVSSETAIIAWNWSWVAYEKDPTPGIINNLPKDVILLVDFERGGTKNILGKKRFIDEYSLSFAGPSERFIKSIKCAKKAGLKSMAKLQLGTTHELATVPNLPLTGNLYDKAKYIKENDLIGFMGCWNFGNMISANTAAFNYFLNKEKLSEKKFELSAFASEYFPECNPKLAAEAWLKFSDAMDYYPFSMPFIYRGVINYSLAFPIKAGEPDNIPCGRSWLLEETRGDSLDNSLGRYTLDEIIKCLELLAKEWKKGAILFEKALGESDCLHSDEELNTAWTCYHAFRSAWNTYRAYKLRKEWSKEKMPDYILITKDERENLKQVINYVIKDGRQGFHGEAFGYMFNERLIRRKISLLN